MRAVTDHYAAQCSGCALLTLRYPTDENLPENAEGWVPTDVPGGLEWMRLYGSVRAISYHDFEMTGEDCVAEDLVFYVWREPGGEWIGGMGGYE